MISWMPSLAAAQAVRDRAHEQLRHDVLDLRGGWGHMRLCSGGWAVVRRWADAPPCP